LKIGAPTRRTALAALAAAAQGWPALQARAQSGFPSRAVRLVVPYSVGIGPDVVARSVAEQLKLQWGQPVLVDNKPGASGIVAFGEVRRTAADGHTLYLADAATLAVNPLLHATLPYDPVRDLEPLTLLFRATFVVWVGAGSRFHSLAELQDAARRNPGGLSYASLGNGHPSQLAVESYAHAAGLKLLHVPFKDGGALMSAVVSGDVDMTTFSVNTMAGLLASGRMRPLAVAARERLATHPAIPTLREAGGPAMEMHPWAALMTRAGTPAPVLATLQLNLAEALASPSVRNRAEAAGFDITPSSAQAVRDRMAAETATVQPLIAAGRVSPI
jgi:tripartite-type tricarboxylate transporter receptor subunit TctC